MKYDLKKHLSVWSTDPRLSGAGLGARGSTRAHRAVETGRLASTASTAPPRADQRSKYSALFLLVRRY